MSMLLDLSRLRGGGGRIDRQDPPDVFNVADEDFRVVGPVVFGADAHKDKDKVRLVGRVTSELEMACGRCLEPFRIPVDSTFDLLFLPLSEQQATLGEEDRQLGDDDASASYYEDQSIDLAQVVREQFYLALPMKPLCREDCKGLCPVCGINRNTDSCSCQSEWVDPRMDALRHLKNNKVGH